MANLFDQRNAGLRSASGNPLDAPVNDTQLANPLSVGSTISAPSPQPQRLDPEISPFESGLRTGALGLEAGLRGFAANIAETAGAKEFAKSQLSEINNTLSRVPNTNYATRLEDIKDAGGLYEFATSSLGQAIPSMAAAVAGGVAGRVGAKRLGLTPGQATFAGAAAGSFPQEAGEAAVSMYNDPYVMANTTAGERTLNMLGKGAVGAALEAVPEAMFVGKLASGVAPAAARGFRPGARYIGTEALKAGGAEALTEAGQEISGQAFKSFINPNEDLLPSGMDVLNAAAQGFLPGSVMGGVGSMAELARSRATGRTQESGDQVDTTTRGKFADLYDVAQNPELSRLVADLDIPADVRKQGANSVAEWMAENNYAEQILNRAREVAADPNAMDVARQNAQAIIDNPNDASLWGKFTGLATAEQKGRQTGELMARLASPFMQNVFGKKNSDPNQRFSAMNTELTDADKPLVEALTPFLSSSSADQVAAAVPLIKNYITAFEADSSAKVPAGLMGLFKEKSAQDGIRTAYQTLLQMGEIGNNPEADYGGFVEDVIQRQSMFNTLLKDNVPPDMQSLISDKGKRNLLISAFESLSAEAPTNRDAADRFVGLAQEVFGNNYQRALTAMEPLLPQGTGSILGSGAAQGQAELEAMTRDLGAGISSQTGSGADLMQDRTRQSALEDAGVSETRSDVSWRFSRKDNKEAFDTAVPSEAEFMANASKLSARSGNVEAVPTGVAEYARLTGDTAPLRSAQAKAPGLSPAELDARFKIIGNYKKGQPEAEQFTYDEVAGKASKVKSDFAAIKFYEPGAKTAKVVTSPAKLISAIREKAQDRTGGQISDAESAARDFSRAMGAMLSVEKDGQPAFDRVMILTKDAAGKDTYVPLQDLPDSFSLFQGVTVGDAKKAMQARTRTVSSTQRFTDVTPEDMSLQELRDLHQQATQKYSELVAEYKKVQGKPDKKARAAAKKLREQIKQTRSQVEAVRAEVRQRLDREGLASGPEDVRDALLDEALPSGNELVPNEQATDKSAATGYTQTMRPRKIENAPLQEGGGVTSVIASPRFEAVNLPGESETISQQTSVDRTRPDITPGDVTAAQLGPRMFQEETGEPLLGTQPMREVAPTAEMANAKHLLDKIKDAPDSSIKRTITAKVQSLFSGGVSKEQMRGALKEAERQAIVNGLMSPEDARYQHRKLPGTKNTSIDALLDDEMSSEDKKAITDWLSKVLPNFTLQFVKDLGGMSGSYSKDALDKAVIRINVHSYDPMSVAYHEAVHDLFDQLAKGGHEQVLDMLKRVSSNKIILGKLTKLLQGNPSAIAQLRDPEEAAAYLFQFWMTGQIEVGPQTQSLFERIINAVRKFLNLLTDQQQAEHLFQMFSAGQLRDSVQRDDSLTALMTPRHKQMMSAAKPLVDMVGKITNTVDARFRESGNPALVEIINLFNGAPNENKLGFFAAVAQARNRQINLFAEDIKDFSKEQLETAVEELQLERPLSAITDPDVLKVVTAVRKRLEQLHSYLRSKGVQRWDPDTNQYVPLGYIENYFPRTWDVDALVSNGSEFVDDLVANHSKELETMAKNEMDRRRQADPNDTTVISVRDLAEAIQAKMVRNMGVADPALTANETGLKENEGLLGFSPAMNAANERLLPFLKKDVFAKYMSKDLVSIMTRYIHQGVKRAEYAERFGNTGSKIEQLLEQSEQNALKAELEKDYGRSIKTRIDRAEKEVPRNVGEPYAEYLTRALADSVDGIADATSKAQSKLKPEFESNRAAVMALEGTLGHDISDGLRKVNSALMTYQNWRVLPLALFSSVIDPLGIMARGGTLKQAYEGMKRGIKEIAKSWKGEFTGAEDPDVKLAELIGTLEPSSFLDSLGQTYGSSFLTGTSRRANDLLFRLNGMEAWNRAMRTQATVSAIEFIKDLKLAPTKDSQRHMEELGLTIDDIVIKEDGSLDLSNKDKKLQFAIMKWVDGAILRPNAAQRPAWASNPKYALLFHLSQFSYSFHKVILTRMYNEAKNGNYDPLVVAAAGYVPAMMFAGTVKAFIQGGGDEPDWMKGDTLVDAFGRGVKQAGLLGIPGLWMDKLPYGVAGPTVQQGVDAVLRDQSFGDTVEKSLPLSTIYRHWW